jgi:septum formation protein
MIVVLASASPRRAKLLQQMGVEFEIKPVDIDETPLNNEAPAQYVKRLAMHKAQAARAFYLQGDKVIVGSDTSVILEGEILGKPDSKQHGLSMLKKLSGRTHEVMTAVAVLGKFESCIVNVSCVTFATVDDKSLEWYWNTGEPKDKAGAYAIQGKAAAFITRLEGSFSGVMGLPLYETIQLLKQHGVKIE